MKSSPFEVLTDPSKEEVSNLLASTGSAGLRGIENYSGTVHLWRYQDGTHMIVASMLGIPYDPANDYVNTLTGKTFYIRSLDDWLSREHRRSEPDSFSSKCRAAKRRQNEGGG